MAYYLWAGLESGVLWGRGRCRWTWASSEGLSPARQSWMGSWTRRPGTALSLGRVNREINSSEQRVKDICIPVMFPVVSLRLMPPAG